MISQDLHFFCIPQSSISQCYPRNERYHFSISGQRIKELIVSIACFSRVPALQNWTTVLSHCLHVVQGQYCIKRLNKQYSSDMALHTCRPVATASAPCHSQVRVSEITPTFTKKAISTACLWVKEMSVSATSEPWNDWWLQICNRGMLGSGSEGKVLAVGVWGPEWEPQPG